MEKSIDQMDLILSNLFKGYISTIHSPGVLLSGGIDSSVITYFISRNFSPYFIYSMGTKKTKDREFIEIMSSFLSQPYDWTEITKQSIQEVKHEVSTLLKKNGILPNLMQLSLGVGYFLIFQKASRQGIRYMFTGQGPDVLLGGYHKYKGVLDLNSQINQDIILLEIDKKRDAAMASHFGITLINPYLEQTFVDFALSLPQEYKRDSVVEKLILRKFAQKKGFPEQIIQRPKKAFQYSTGIQSICKKV